MQAALLEKLICPVCNSHMIEDGKSIYCTGIKKHCFDYAKSGYLNFNMENRSGDGKESVKARRAFLSQGYYAPLAERICELLKEYKVESFLDAGCGEGSYTNAFAKVSSGFGLDLSKDGIDLASKEKKTIGLTSVQYLVGSIFRLPLEDGSLDCVLNLFAPCAEEEYTRVLKKNGILILAGAGKEHLLGLKKALYDDVYLNEDRRDLPIKMKKIHEENLTYEIEVQGEEQVKNLFSMTPYYWRTSMEDKQKLDGLPKLNTKVDFILDIFVKEQ